MKLTELPRGTVASVTQVGGTGSFRRRLMELGMVPGTRVEVRGVAPLGDPLELLVRGASLSIRRAEALTIEVRPAADAAPANRAVEKQDGRSELLPAGCARGTP